METQQAHWVGRIDKINKKEFSDTILVNTWIVNRSSSVYKPFDTENEFQDLFNAYFKSNKSDKLRNKIFERSLWYAAYIAIFAAEKYRYLCQDLNHYLGYAMKRLWEDIKLFDPKESSFYTYVLNDYNFRIRRETEEIYGVDNLSAGVRIRMRTVMNKAIFLGLSFDDIVSMDELEFKRLFSVSKDLFIKMMAARDIDSLNRTIDCEDGSVSEIGDYVEDTYTSSFSDKLIENLSICEIYDLAEKLYNGRIRFYHIWKKYSSGSYSLQEIGTEYGITRERVRQIVKMVNDHLKTNKRIMQLKDTTFS